MEARDYQQNSRFQWQLAMEGDFVARNSLFALSPYPDWMDAVICKCGQLLWPSKGKSSGKKRNVEWTCIYCKGQQRICKRGKVEKFTEKIVEKPMKTEKKTEKEKSLQDKKKSQLKNLLAKKPAKSALNLEQFLK